MHRNIEARGLETKQSTSIKSWTNTDGGNVVKCDQLVTFNSIFIFKI